MVHVGQFNKLKVIKEVAFGVYLDGEEFGEVLLPSKVVPKGTLIGDEVNVFIYFDSEDKIIVTTKRPRAFVGSFASLRVIDINRAGAFLDWGLDKDLLVPKALQHRPMTLNNYYVVYIFNDNEGRIVASTKLDYYLDKTPPEYMPGEEVNLIIAGTSPLGYKAIINNQHWGLIHRDDVFQSIALGNKLPGYIKKIRADGKIDVVLRKMGQDSVDELSERILEELNKADGYLPLHDKSNPEDIKRVFNESKKNFKRSLGLLYKRGKILLEAEGIRLKEKSHKAKKG
jgi:uncharacterized protein